MLRSVETGQIVEPLDVVSGESRSHPDRPWVMMNMIASIDGATAVDGKSSSLGDEDDLAMFKAIRSVPDVVLVGAGTVKAEDYQPLVLDDQRKQIRNGHGQAADPVLAIVSGRLSVDVEARVFSDAEHKPLILTSTSADPGRLVTLGDAAQVAFLSEMTPRHMLDQLAAASIVLIEGGPTLNAQFVAAGLVDEVNLTISPALVGGESRRIASGPEARPPLDMTLDRALMGQRSLFLRYLKAGATEDLSHG